MTPEDWYFIDSFTCQRADYRDAHPEIYGVAFSPQGEVWESFAQIWLWSVYLKAKEGCL